MKNSDLTCISVDFAVFYSIFHLAINHSRKQINFILECADMNLIERGYPKEKVNKFIEEIREDIYQINKSKDIFHSMRKL